MCGMPSVRVRAEESKEPKQSRIESVLTYHLLIILFSFPLLIITLRCRKHSFYHHLPTWPPNAGIPSPPLARHVCLCPRHSSHRALCPTPGPPCKISCRVRLSSPDGKDCLFSPTLSCPSLGYPSPVSSCRSTTSHPSHPGVSPTLRSSSPHLPGMR
ncbi:hypothetical protein LY78DRAFT_327800 [Colletotrichum sublineola]|nr:hypothetical protein LY78DRAFT_327800 [Colletotrichum sublineola]